VAMDYEEEVRKYDDGTLPGVTYFMPDGQDIKLKEILCRVTDPTPWCRIPTVPLTRSVSPSGGSGVPFRFDEAREC
jgi:hypothetical protein